MLCALSVPHVARFPAYCASVYDSQAAGREEGGVGGGLSTDVGRCLVKVLSARRRLRLNIREAAIIEQGFSTNWLMDAATVGQKNLPSVSHLPCNNMLIFRSKQACSAGGGCSTIYRFV